MIAVVFLLVSVSLSDARQQAVAVRYALEHDMRVLALAGHDPQAARASVECGRTSAVLAAIRPPTDELDELERAVRVLYCRADVARVELARDARTDMIRVALRNSHNDFRMIARLFGMSESFVRSVARTG